MHFVVHAVDKPDALPRRFEAIEAIEAIEAHRSHLDNAPARHGIKILLSGPLTDDDGALMRGSFFLLEAPNREAVEALFAKDPLTTADVWDTRSVNAVTLRQNNIRPA